MRNTRSPPPRLQINQNIGIRPASKNSKRKHENPSAMNHAQHQRLEQAGGDHVFLDSASLRSACRADHQRHHNVVSSQTGSKCASTPDGTEDPSTTCLSSTKLEPCWTGQSSNRMNSRSGNVTVVVISASILHCAPPRRSRPAGKHTRISGRQKAGHEGNDGKQVDDP